MLEHGGRLREAAQTFGVPLADWLDLSTGIAPAPYPLPPVPAAVWQRLPEDDDGLEAAARAYYGAASLAVPGSQWAIRALPRLLPPGRVAMPQPLYAEHPAAWRAAGHELVPWWDANADYGLVCQPNNPDGRRLPREALLERAGRLRLLVVDEAFIDAEPAESLVDAAGERLAVLRSLGKFFGLAGARVGFVFAAPELLARLSEAAGPWAVAHPARWAARLALSDTAWQAARREHLIVASARLAQLLCAAGLPESTGTALFRHVATPRAAAIHEALARRGILVRRFDDPPALRFGLPGDESQWRRLAAALAGI